MAKSLTGTKTHQNLKDAFAGESQANRRYLYFAKVADVEGYPEIAGNFKETADGETGHAHGHLDYLKQVGDPATGLPIGNTEKNLKAAVAGETHEYETMYPGMAKSARDEGFDDIAEWFETLAKAEKSHAGRFQKMLDALEAERRDEQTTARTPGNARGAERGVLRRRLSPGDPGVLRVLAASRSDVALFAAASHAQARSQARAAAGVRPERRAVLGRARSRGRDAADVRDLPRLPHVRRLLRLVSGRLRAGRPRHREARRRRAPSCSTSRDFASATDLCWQCKLCYIEVPVHAGRGARVDDRHPAPADAREGAAREAQRRSRSRTASSASRSSSGR